MLHIQENITCDLTSWKKLWLPLCYYVSCVFVVVLCQLHRLLIHFKFKEDCCLSVSRVMWSTVCVLGVVGGRGLFPRVLCMVSQNTRVLLSSSSRGTSGLLLRRELAASLVAFVCLTHIGSMRLVSCGCSYIIKTISFLSKMQRKLVGYNFL